MTDWEIELDDGRRVPVTKRAELAELFERFSGRREERPFILSLIGPPGCLSFGVGRPRTLLEHEPANGNSPYHESRGSVPAGEVVVYFLGGDWTEIDSEAEVEWIDAKRAILEFFGRGVLSSAIRWVEV